MWPVTLLKICLLRANPQDLPTSTALTALALAVYGAVDVVSALATVPLMRAIQFALVDTFLLGTFTHLTLNLRRLSPRLRQTLTALAGCGVLLSIPALVLTGSIGSATPSVLWVPLLLWFVAVYGHILRHALDIRLPIGIAAACGYFFLTLVITAPLLILPPAN